MAQFTHAPYEGAGFIEQPDKSPVCLQAGLSASGRGNYVFENQIHQKRLVRFFIDLVHLGI